MLSIKFNERPDYSGLSNILSEMINHQDDLDCKLWMKPAELSGIPISLQATHESILFKLTLMDQSLSLGILSNI